MQRVHVVVSVHPHRPRRGGVEAHAVDRDGRAVRADHRSANLTLALMSIEIVPRRKGSSAEACMRCSAIIVFFPIVVRKERI